MEILSPKKEIVFFPSSIEGMEVLFLIPSILPTVPGVGMYRIVYYMIIGDMETAGYYLTYVLQIAGMIAIGIFIMETFFRTFVKKEYLQKKRNI